MSPLRKTRVETLDPRCRPLRTEPPAFEVLLDELVDGDPEVRRRAVGALGERPEALPILIERLGAETDRTVRDALCGRLVGHDQPVVADGLVRYLSSDDAGLRTAVVGVLALLPNATGRRIPQLLVDPDPDVRILTVMLLGQLRADEVVDWLTGLVRDDPDPNVVAAAIGELVSLVGARCAPDLRRVQARFPDDPFIAFLVNQGSATTGAGSR